MAETFNVTESIKVQAQYCEEKGLPHFAPRSGVCWNCNKNIYEQHPSKYNPNRMNGLSVEEAKTQLVTGCPHCNRSYCD